MRPAPAGAATLHSGPLGAPGPALLTFALRGETVVHMEARLGYAHRGVLALMTRRPASEAAGLAARLSGEATVAHSLAYARAAEAALGAEPPPRAMALRAVASDVERLAVQLYDLARTAEAEGKDPARFIDLREKLVHASHLAFGHRLLMDLVLPGGVSRDIAPEGVRTLDAVLDGLGSPRAWRPEVREMRDLLRDRLRSLPEGVLLSSLPVGSGEGLGRADGARGVHFWWVRLQDGRVTHCFARDPAWLLWPACTAEAVGKPLGDVVPRAAARGLSVGGMDL